MVHLGQGHDLGVARGLAQLRSAEERPNFSSSHLSAEKDSDGVAGYAGNTAKRRHAMSVHGMSTRAGRDLISGLLGIQDSECSTTA